MQKTNKKKPPANPPAHPPTHTPTSRRVFAIIPLSRQLPPSYSIPTALESRRPPPEPAVGDMVCAVGETLPAQPFKGRSMGRKGQGQGARRLRGNGTARQPALQGRSAADCRGSAESWRSYLCCVSGSATVEDDELTPQRRRVRRGKHDSLSCCPRRTCPSRCGAPACTPSRMSSSAPPRLTSPAPTTFAAAGSAPSTGHSCLPNPTPSMTN